MTAIAGLLSGILAALDEREVARRVALAHDDARMRYALRQNTSPDFDDFSNTIGDYYNHHFSAVNNGASLSRMEAIGRAKEALEREYRRQHGDILTAFKDAHDGTSGGLRAILDLIADAMKYESTERYVRHVFDTHVAPNSFETKVELIRQLIQRLGPGFTSSIQADAPERYAHEYQPLVQTVSQGLNRTASIFRRL